MPGEDMFGQDLSAISDNMDPIRGVYDFNYGYPDAWSDQDDDAANEAEIQDIREWLDELIHVVSETWDEIEARLELPDARITSLLRRLGVKALEVSKRAHWVAAQRTFKEKNPHYENANPHTALAEIDLHGLSVHEAIGFAKEHLDKCKSSGLGETKLICGWGKNSHGGPKIKPELIKLVWSRGFECTVPYHNPGLLVVNLNARIDDNAD